MKTSSWGEAAPVRLRHAFLEGRKTNACGREARAKGKDEEAAPTPPGWEGGKSSNSQHCADGVINDHQIPTNGKEKNKKNKEVSYICNENTIYM